MVLGFLAGRQLNGWTGLFLATTIATSVTGFFFPFHAVTPGIVLGVISLIVLAVAIVARYGLHLAGVWRSTCVVSAALALYLNVFVLVVQSFQKVPALKALAPKGTEPPFAVAQLIVLALFVVLTIAALKRFKPKALAATAR